MQNKIPTNAHDTDNLQQLVLDEEVEVQGMVTPNAIMTDQLRQHWAKLTSNEEHQNLAQAIAQELSQINTIMFEYYIVIYITL